VRAGATSVIGEDGKQYMVLESTGSCIEPRLALKERDRNQQAKMEILIADDSSINVRMLSMQLSKIGLGSIVTANSGMQAVRRAKECTSQILVVFLDRHLGDMLGRFNHTHVTIVCFTLSF
jgi:PleD family two-component response regulator